MASDLKTQAAKIALKLKERNPAELKKAAERVAAYAKRRYGLEKMKTLTEQEVLEICAKRMNRTAQSLLNDPDYARVMNRERQRIGRDLLKRTAKELGLTESEVQVLTQVGVLRPHGG